MDKIAVEFTNLYRRALHAQPMQDQTISDITKLKELADRHNAWPLVFTLLQERYADEAPCPQWSDYRNAFFKLCVKNMQHMYGLRKILSTLENAGIPYAVLKGESLAALYPHPECRISSDIDLFVHPEDEARAVELLLQHNVQVEPRIPHAHHRDCKSNACGKIELHTQWQGDLQNDILYDSKLESVETFITMHTEALGDFYTLGINDGLYMHFAHLMTHFIGGGFGIRLISDVLLYIRKHKKSIDAKAFRSFLAALGYNKFMDVLLSIGVCHLGFDKKEFFDFELDVETADLLLEDCLSGGAFGHAEAGRFETHDAYLQERMENSGQDYTAYKAQYASQSHKKKLSFGTQNMQNLYPYVRKSKLFLPIAYLHHCCFIISRGFAKLFRKKPVQKPMHENAQKRQSLLERLELKQKR